MLGAGAAAWTYNKMHRSTGGNVQNAAIVAGVAGVFAFVAGLIAGAIFLK